MAIVSANAYTSQILNSFSELIFPFQGQAFVTDPIPTRLFNEVIYANFGFEYWRQLKDGRLMVGGFREKDPKKVEKKRKKPSELLASADSRTHANNIQK